MKVRSIFMGAALLAGAMFIGCSDDDDDCIQDYTGPLAENETPLVGKWVLSGITSSEEVDITDDDEENPSTDIYAQYTDCQKDAAYTFNEDRDYKFEQGTTASDCQGKVTTNGTWQYTNNQISLVTLCTVLNLPVTFTNAGTSFQSVSQLLIKDVTGQTVQAEVTFTYTKATAED
jgi:hypothetical protein